MSDWDFIVIGGGAAGFFAALSFKHHHPTAKVLILEKNQALLSKVRVSGGGRCNVTHACFDPALLVKNYPRGPKELMGPFHRFGPQDTLDWFETRGVRLKAEDDGRMFPTTNSSDTIIQCFLSEAHKLCIEIHKKAKVVQILRSESGFEIQTTSHLYACKKLLLATGSSPQGYEWAQDFGHTIVPPVPSLFTFNVPNSPLKDLSGISLQNALVKIKECHWMQQGPVLITHFGFSGPAVLKLSAWGARYLYEKKYNFEIVINWMGRTNSETLRDELISLKKKSPDKTLYTLNPWKLPKKFWKCFIDRSSVQESTRLNDLSTKMINSLVLHLTHDEYQIQGKTTHKEEFVTCGGIELTEVDFKTMQSKKCKNLFFAGEILNIDGVTGGFNFQNAWTTGYIAGIS